MARRKRLKRVKKTINTMFGKAKYIGTEIEDKYGRWDDSYLMKEGYFVIHKGKHHHVYYAKPPR